MVRRCADWPTSVLSMSARLEPSQSSLASPEPLRNGRMARETSGPAGGLAIVVEVSLPLTVQPAMATAAASVAATIHFQGIARGGTGAGITTDAAIGRLPSQASR